MFWNYLTLLQEIRWDDILDIGLTTILLSIGIHVIRTARTRGVAFGFLFFGGVFLIARHLELKLTTWMLQGVAAVFVLVVVIVYQAEIRRFFEQFPARVLRSKIRKGEVPSGVAELLTEVVTQLSTQGWGALIILPGRDTLEGIVTEGLPLDGSLSKALLLSIFDPNSPGHDGALIVSGDRIERFAARLPLSDQEEQLRDRGTRHAAALGLAEKTDALVVAVSEESSRVSVARHGQLQTLSSIRNLNPIIDEFLLENAGELQPPGRFEKIFGWVRFEALSALGIAVTLWLVLVPGSVVESFTYEVPIKVQNIPEGFALLEVVPPEVSVTLSGERRHLFQLKSKGLEIRLDGTLTRFGRQTFSISRTHLLLPSVIEIAHISPEDVRVLVKKED